LKIENANTLYCPGGVYTALTLKHKLLFV